MKNNKKLKSIKIEEYILSPMIPQCNRCEHCKDYKIEAIDTIPEINYDNYELCNKVDRFCNYCENDGGCFLLKNNEEKKYFCDRCKSTNLLVIRRIVNDTIHLCWDCSEKWVNLPKGYHPCIIYQNKLEQDQYNKFKAS